MIKLEVKADNFNRALFELRDALGKEMGPLLLKEEARQLLKAHIHRKNRLVMMKSKRGTTAKMVREKAVEYSIHRTMNPLLSSQFHKWEMKVLAVKLHVKADNAYAQEVFDKIKKGRLRNAKAVYPKAAYHKANIISATGATNYTNFRVIGEANHALLASYVKAAQGRVGWAFAGWLRAAKHLGLKLPKWITRHGEAAPGAYGEDRMGDETWLTISNSSSYRGILNRALEDELLFRAKAIARKAERITLGEAANLGFMTWEKGMTIAQWKASQEHRDSFNGMNIQE